jgi:mannosyltransferase OCH1-like enzyme
MIPKNAFFFWNQGTKLSYLRYKTLTTFRDLHPDWKIYICNPKISQFQKWQGPEKQDFLDKSEGIDYLEKSKELDVTIIDYKKHNSKAPMHTADFFRWDVMYNNGGWFFDLDQIFLKNFDDLCNYDFVFDGSGQYYIGVIGLAKGCEIGKYVYKNMYNAYNPAHYCCTGPWYMRSLMQPPGDLRYKSIEEKYNVLYAPGDYFYPIDSSDDVYKLYDEKINISEDAYAIHWYGGHPESQKFNKKFTEDTEVDFDNTISKYLK